MDITKLIETIVLVIIAPFVPLAVLQLKRWMDVHVSDQQQQIIYLAVRTAVLAAEQMGLSGVEAKKKAIEIADHTLAANGLAANLDYLADLIEAEVFDQFNRGLVGLRLPQLPEASDGQ